MSSGSAWCGTGPQEVRLQTLKCHIHHRCTFEIALKTEAGWRSVIAKVYLTDRSDLFQSMDAVRGAGFGPEAEVLDSPTPRLRALRARLLVEKVPGRSSKEIFLRGNADEHRTAAERSGRWLARFHAAAPKISAARERSDEFARYRRWRDQIAGFGERCLRSRPSGSSGSSKLPHPRQHHSYSAGHGSYIPEHVILSGRRTTTIDLDECDVADPGRDLAWFVVSLQRMA